MWRQRSRQVWLHHGDRHSRFFHSKANGRKKENFVARLLDDWRHWVTSPVLVEKMFVEYYIGLFSSKGTSNLETVMKCLSPRVTLEINELLMQPFQRKMRRWPLMKCILSKLLV